MAEKFKKRVEDFVCINCGLEVKGNGYTNHCPRCLWSRHVDIHPGDRAEECDGPMQPIGAEKEGEDWIVFHKCLKCHEIKKVRIQPQDNFDVVIKLAAGPDMPLT